ncbi:MAG: hypothetical protein K8S16_13890 [Bacteroidales bacterium]|nr:hypothetical protein [Bacteroidales bacterium]
MPDKNCINIEINNDLFLRYPGESRSENNKSYYILRISNTNTELHYDLISKNIDEEDRDGHISKSVREFRSHIKIRVRFVGNLISVWEFEKLLMKDKLLDFSKEFDLPDITIRKLDRINNGLLKLNIVDDSIVFSNRIKTTKKINYKTAFDGLVGFRDSDKGSIKSIEIKDAYLYKTRFTTSKFSNIYALIKGYDENIQYVEVENLTNDMSMSGFYEAKLKAYLWKIKFENKLIEEQKVLDRDLFEIKNQELATASKQLDDNFYGLLSTIGDGELAYIETPDKLTLHILKPKDDDNKVLGIYMHSPEPLHIKFDLSDAVDNIKSHGRMEITMKDSSGNMITCTNLHNSDFTKLLILLETEIEKHKIYRLNFLYVRDYCDDKYENLDHLFDRAYELNRSSKKDFEGYINLDIS